MRRVSIAFLLALAASALYPSTALAEPTRPPAWGHGIICIEGYRPLTHPVFLTWGDVGRCVPDR